GGGGGGGGPGGGGGGGGASADGSGRAIGRWRALAEQRARVHHLEGAAGHRLELVQVVVVPARVAGAGDEPARAVVGDHHAVLLERVEHHAGLAGEARDVEAGLQAQAQAQGREVGVVRGAGEVRGGMDVGAL